MKYAASQSNIRELRSQFLRESKQFCKFLDDTTDNINGEVKAQMLEEMRQKLKYLLDVITEIERKELHKT
jgi:hypothetical protein